MKCSKCGAELSEDARFCSYCGNKIGANQKQPGTKESLISSALPNEPVKESCQKDEGPKSLADKIKERANAQWSKLSTYGKVATIASAVSLFLGLAAFLFGKKAPIIIATVQIVMIVVSVLMHKRIIKLEQRKLWLKWLIMAIAILLTALNIKSYS